MSDWPKVIPPYKPGCPWNDWLHAIAEALKKDPDLLKKLQPPPPKTP